MKRKTSPSFRIRKFLSSGKKSGPKKVKTRKSKASKKKTSYTRVALGTAGIGALGALLAYNKLKKRPTASMATSPIQFSASSAPLRSPGVSTAMYNDDVNKLTKLLSDCNINFKNCKTQASDDQEKSKKSIELLTKQAGDCKALLDYNEKTNKELAERMKVLKDSTKDLVGMHTEIADLKNKLEKLQKAYDATVHSLNKSNNANREYDALFKKVKGFPEVQRVLQGK